jgi:hypothetical protein
MRTLSSMTKAAKDAEDVVLSGPSVTPDMAREVAEILHPDALKVRGEDDEEWNERQK